MGARRKDKKMKEEKTMDIVNETINTEEIVNPETVEEVVESTEETIVENNENVEGVTEVTETVEEVSEEGSTEVLEDTNISSDDTIVEESSEEETFTEEEKPVVGKIQGFSKLYVRKEASKDSEPAGVVNEDDELFIDVENSTEDFYKVTTSNGLDGYCVKTNVKID